MKGAWPWIDEVIEKVRNKQEAFTSRGDSKSSGGKEANRAKYKLAKKEVTKPVTLAKDKAYNSLFQ